MALNLSTLTNSATSASILNEALTTADLLDPVPILKNFARGSQKGGDAKQTTGLNQPRALPLIKNPSGNLGGYLYIPNVTGNYATGPSVTIGANETWEAEVDVVITQFGNYIAPFGGGIWDTGFGFIIRSDGAYRAFSKGATTSYSNSNDPIIPFGSPTNIKYGFNGTLLYVDINGQRAVDSGGNQSSSITHPLHLNQQTLLTHTGNYAIQKAKLTVNSAVVFDCDFNGSTSIRHGDTKFNCVGGPVSLTRAGQDPITVVKKGVLRFDGANDGLNGLFNQTINDGYFFAAFSVLGDGGASYGRLFGGADLASHDVAADGFVLRKLSSTETLNLDIDGAISKNVTNGFTSDLGDYVLESRLKSGEITIKINGTVGESYTDTFYISSERFNIGEFTQGNYNAAIDLEYLALFPASITDAEANSVRNYINNRNNVFSLIDSQGYYFYNAQSAPVGAITTGSASWNGRIVGSDNGDSDRYLTQGTTNDAPVGDGYVVTFADNADHLEIPSTTQAGWQVVGTSLGTFAYRVDNDAVTELHLLGNDAIADGTTYRKAGDLYGMLLLPTSATGSDIAETKKLLTDRGASEQAEGSNYYAAWYQRRDIVEFGAQSFPYATNFGYAWSTCLAMTNFGAIQAPLGSAFQFAWKGTSALTSFPAGAKLGTSASNVNFTNAWQSSGLTSFPALDLSKGNNFSSAFQSCSALTTIEDGILLGTSSSSVDFTSAFKACVALTTLPSNLDLSKGDDFQTAFQNCQSLVDFPAGAFDTMGTPQSYCFLNTWLDNNALSAASVENILVSINNSGQSAPSTGPEITIKYNTATGSLSAATNTAVTSLKSKGWSIVVNGVTL